MTNYVFLERDTNELINPISVTFNNGQLDILTGYTNSNMETTTYTPDEYICMYECLNVPGIGILRDGDLIKLNLFDKTFYTLHFGWYTTNDGLDLYGWYLVNNEQIKPFYERYLQTLEICQQSCNC